MLHLLCRASLFLFQAAAWFFLGLLFAATASADELQTRVTRIIYEASRISGYQIPEQPLEIYLIAPDVMAAAACKGKAICQAVGLYQDQNVVLLTPQAALDLDATLLHEIVHWLQHHSGKFKPYLAGSCEELRTREIEAYRAQNRYVSEVQHRMDTLTMPPIRCQMDF